MVGSSNSGKALKAPLRLAVVKKTDPIKSHVADGAQQIIQIPVHFKSRLRLLLKLFETTQRLLATGRRDAKGDVSRG